ncbi:MAG TPA: response regulator transcription factor [bacterium]|nr:response regulator transcription factor [bacterium]
MGTKKILIVDDHAMFRARLRSMLDNLPIAGRILEAEDGENAVRLAKEQAPDLIFMDIAMAGMNGIEATRRILRESPTAKVIMVTVHAKNSFVEESLAAGASGYLIKKHIHEELAPAIEKVLKNEMFISQGIQDM